MNKNKQVPIISKVNQTGRVDKPMDLVDARKKRKGKDVLVEELRKKKRISMEETIVWIETLKRSKYSVVE